jgi:tetratricopeptide (TPR) repeat protein
VADRRAAEAGPRGVDGEAGSLGSLVASLEQDVGRSVAETSTRTGETATTNEHDALAALAASRSEEANGGAEDSEARGEGRSAGDSGEARGEGRSAGDSGAREAGAEQDDLPAPVVTTRPFTMPPRIVKRITVQPVTGATNELENSAELDLPQIHTGLADLQPPPETVVASPRPAGSGRPDDVDLDLSDLREAAAETPAAETPPAAEPEEAPSRPPPRTPPPRPRPAPVVASPPRRAPSVATYAAVTALAAAVAGLWWSSFTRAPASAPQPLVARDRPNSPWSAVYTANQTRRLEADRVASYLEALAAAEARGDVLGQAEAALCMHLRYGPDPVRSSAAAVWRAKAPPGDAREARIAGLAALAAGDVAAAERLLVGDDARTQLYRALAAQRRGDDEAAAAAARAALALRPGDVAAELVAATAELAARRTAPLDPLRAAAAAHADHPLYQQALVRALLERGRLAEARALADRLLRVTGASEAHQARVEALKAEVAAAGGETAKALWLYEQALQQAPQDLPTPLARVRLLLASDDLARAQQELGALARRAPQAPELLALQAELALRAGDEAAATRAVDRLAEVETERGRVARLRGQVHALAGRPDAAAAAFAAALARDPGDAEAAVALAGLRVRGGAPDPLAPLASAALALQADPRASLRPRLRALALGHADLLVETGRKDQAIGVLDAALAADPDDNAAQLRRGVLAVEQGRAAAGRADLAAVFERTGGFPGLALPLGRLYLRDGDLVRLAALVQPHVSDRYAPDDVVLTAGLLRLAQGDVDTAQAQIDRVVQRNPAMWEARLARARVLLARARVPEAQAELRLARPRSPDAELELWAGKISERLGRPQDAVAAFKRARQIDPSLYEASFLYGRALLEQGLAREAVAELSAVTRATDAFPAAYLALGLALRARGQAEEALSNFLRAALLDPTSGEACYWAGRTRVELGRHPEALDLLRRATLLAGSAPWLADAQLWLARALVRTGEREEAAQAFAAYLRLAGPHAPARAEAEKALRGR